MGSLLVIVLENSMSEASYVIGSAPCPYCREKGEDSSGDNLRLYSNGGSYCFSCNKTVTKSDDYKLKYKKVYSENDFPMTNYTKEDWLRDKATYSVDPRGYRGLKQKTCEVYQVHHEFTEVDGQPIVMHQFYPLTKAEEFSGVKVRIAYPEKDFRAKGHCKADCELFGQAVFRSSSSKFIVITSGELDALSAFQMLNDDGLRRKDENGDYLFPVIPVVSGTAGEASSLKQYRANYDFLNRFETIYIIPDKDDKGEEALHKVAQALPKDKLKVIDLPAKDANKLLEDGRGRDFINAFWKAKFYSPVGIHGSDSIYEKILEKALVPKIPFPPFLQRVNDVSGGGMVSGSIINVLAGSGSGKALTLDAKVLTKGGWKRNGDLTLDDIIITPKGKESKLIGIFDFESKPIFNFTFKSGRTSQSCDEHLWLINEDHYGVFEEKLVETKYIVDSFVPEKFSVPTCEPIQLSGNLGTTSFELYSIESKINLLKSNIFKNSIIIKGVLSYYNDLPFLKDIQKIIFSLGGVAEIIEDIKFKPYLLLKEDTLNKLFNPEDYSKPVVDYIVDVSYVGDLPCRCIYIEDEDHLYLTDDYLITHNTTLINQCALYWIKEGFRPGVVSLEADLGTYGENVLGVYLKEKLQLITDPAEKYEYLKSEKIKQAAIELFYDQEGKPTFHVIDERGDYDNLQPKIEELIISCNTRIVIIDVLSDIFDGMPLDFQSKWMSWEKAICKRYGVIIVNIVHARKGGSGQKTASAGAVLQEEDMIGSGTIYKSASLNLILARDKNAEDEFLKNLVEVHISKNRETGWTGSVAKLQYDMKSHTLSDATNIFDEYLENNKDKQEEYQAVNRF